MYIKRELNNWYELKDMVWSGAVDTLAEVERQDREQEALDLIEDVFYDEVPTATQVNDFIWFDLADMMGLYDEEDEEEEDEDD